MIEAVRKIKNKLNQEPDEKKYKETDIKYYYFSIEVSYEDFVDKVYQVNDSTPDGVMCWPNWENNGDRFILVVQTSKQFKNKEIPEYTSPNRLNTPESPDDATLNL